LLDILGDLIQRPFPFYFFQLRGVRHPIERFDQPRLVHGHLINIALTGIKCDRLQEERDRGITIVLGYAHMRLPSGIKVGIVDVPGQEGMKAR